MPSRSKLAGLIAIFVIACTVSLAFAAVKTSPSNGNFETGSLKGWKTVSLQGNGTWDVYKQGDDLANSGEQPPNRGLEQPHSLYKPPQGKFAAYGIGTGGNRFLHRTLRLKANRKITLSMDVFYKNFADAFFSPNTFDAPSAKPGDPGSNQQYRIDVIKKSADIDSLKKSDILETVFRTKPGDQLKRKPFKVTTNLSQLGGQTVTLRFAEADNQFYFYPGVDAVKLKQTKKH